LCLQLLFAETLAPLHPQSRSCEGACIEYRALASGVVGVRVMAFNWGPAPVGWPRGVADPPGAVRPPKAANPPWPEGQIGAGSEGCCHPPMRSPDPAELIPGYRGSLHPPCQLPRFWPPPPSSDHRHPHCSLADEVEESPEGAGARITILQHADPA
jgi:hypothetical protein